MDKKNSISYEEAVKIGIREGIRYIKDQEYYKTKKRYDRRLRNTKLLLKHYRGLQKHTQVSKESVNKIQEENAIDVLDDIESINDEEQYVQAIERTKIRTKIIVNHINKAIRYYEHICDKEGHLKKRRFKLLKYMYIDDIKDDEIPTYEDVSKVFNINIKTVGRDIRAAIEDLSILLFGIDGIKL